MDPCTRRYVAREFADQIQISSPRSTTRDHDGDYVVEKLAELRAQRIRDQAQAAAAIWTRRNPADKAPDQAVLVLEFEILIAEYLLRASLADASADLLAAQCTGS